MGSPIDFAEREPAPEGTVHIAIFDINGEKYSFVKYEIRP